MTLTSRKTTKPLGKKNEAYDADSSMGSVVHNVEFVYLL